MSEQKIMRATLQPQQSNSAPDPRVEDRAYKWRVGDVFTNGVNRWSVDSIRGDTAVLRSCSSSWATTMPLTFIEWREGGRWQLEEPSSGP